MNKQFLFYFITSIGLLGSMGKMQSAQTAQSTHQNLPAQAADQNLPAQVAEGNNVAPQQKSYVERFKENHPNIAIAAECASHYAIVLDRYLARTVLPKIWIADLLYRSVALLKHKDIPSFLMNSGDVRYISRMIKIGTQTIPVYVGLNCIAGGGNHGAAFSDGGILLYKDTLTDLSFDKQAGILGHEIIHSMNRDGLKKNLSSVVFYLLFPKIMRHMQTMWNMLYCKAEKNNWNTTAKFMEFCEVVSPISAIKKSFFLSCLYGYLCCKLPFDAWLSRRCETNADIESAKLFGTAQGLSAYFGSCIGGATDPGKMSKSQRLLLASHPSMQNRVTALQPWIGYPGKYKDQLRNALTNIHKDVSELEMFATGKPYVCPTT